MDISNRQIRVPHRAGSRYYDLWHGTEVLPEIASVEVKLSFDLEANGYGAVLGTSAPPAEDFNLAEMKESSRRRLDGFSRERRFLPQQAIDIPPTKPASTAPAGMIATPAGSFEFQVPGIEIEGANEIGVDVQYPWENSPRRHHRTTLPMKCIGEGSLIEVRDVCVRPQVATAKVVRQDKNDVRQPDGAAVNWDATAPCRAGQETPSSGVSRTGASRGNGNTRSIPPCNRDMNRFIIRWREAWSDAASSDPHGVHFCYYPRKNLLTSLRNVCIMGLI
jgi:hypothetical protein